MICLAQWRSTADAMQRYPQSRSLVYGYAEALLAARQYEQGLRFLDSQVQTYSSDYKLYGLQARTFAASGKAPAAGIGPRAEFYLLQGQLGPAVEQLQFGATGGRWKLLRTVGSRRALA
jgi:predicted Zn-dependent protease